MAAQSMTFEPTITLGGVLSPLLTVLALVGLYIKYVFNERKARELHENAMAEQISAIKEDLHAMSGAVRDIGAVLRVQAVQTNRLDHLEKLVDELRHGKGYVLEMEPHRRTFGPGA